MAKPMSTREYRKRLAALPAEAQKQHYNFMSLMEAAKRKDDTGIKQLLQKFRTEKTKP